MAFNRSWDETTPDGAVEASDDIDLIFRQLKEDIRERWEDVSTFGTDTDPMVLLEGTARLTVDIDGNRPSTPDNEGLLFYATDTGKLYVAEDDGGLTWEEVTASSTTASNIIGIGSFADRPSSGLEPGQMYYATDNDYNTLYIATGSTTWQAVAPAPHHVTYSPGASAQARITSTSRVKQRITITIDTVNIGTSPAQGTATIELSEFDQVPIDVSAADITAHFAHAWQDTSTGGADAQTYLDEANETIEVVVTGEAGTTATVHIELLIAE